MQNNYNAYPTAPQPPVYPAAPQGAEPPAGYRQRSRLAAGILGMLAGTLGLHNFYLGNNQRGLTQLLLSTLGAAVTCGISTLVVMVWGISEGVKILEHKTNADGYGYALKD